MALHRLEVQRCLAQTRSDAGRERWINGLGGIEAVLACPGGVWDGDGVVVEIGRYSIKDLLIEAVIVAKVHVIAAEAAIVLTRD